MRRYSVWVLLGLALFTLSLHDLQVSAEAGPSEHECKPYIEKAIHELKKDSAEIVTSQEVPSPEAKTEEEVSAEENVDVTSAENLSQEANDADDDDNDDDADGDNEETTAEIVEETVEETTAEAPASEEHDNDDDDDNDDDKDEAAASEEDEVTEGVTSDAEEDDGEEVAATEEQTSEEPEADEASEELEGEEASEEALTESVQAASEEEEVTETSEIVEESIEEEPVEETVEESVEAVTATEEADDDDDDDDDEEEAEATESAEPAEESTEAEDVDDDNDDDDNNDNDGENDEDTEEEAASEPTEESAEQVVESVEKVGNSVPESEKTTAEVVEDSAEPVVESAEEEEEASPEVVNEEDEASPEVVEETEEIVTESAEEAPEASEEEAVAEETAEVQSVEETKPEDDDDDDDASAAPTSEEEEAAAAESSVEETATDAAEENNAVESEEEEEEAAEPIPEEDLLLEFEIPKNLRDNSHIYELLKINDEPSEKETVLTKTADVILRDLKRIYDNAIKPLETLYKYRDLSNRHFGDPEIFSKPLVLFMGPWSGGKSTILNYLTHNEHTVDSVRTGAEPSPAYFNILMHGDHPEVLDGTSLAADWTFSGLQKFGNGLLERLRGQKLPNKLLEKVNIVEIPGILEVRKQVSQYFPFNDACQWFIDRADIIFLVYDPSKLDVGPETEAILDQLKGREYQTRILLNKADQVKPEELLRVQGALIWNISPLMSSAQPPVMYTVSLWSHPFEEGAPVRLLQAQERQLLLDLGSAIDKRIENKIASARRFAVRVRNHAKMVDCYLTTYYNHKSLFGNKKYISDKIIENPQEYHIYEGLSTLTNISRYDLPDPEVYRDFFRLNPLYEFKKLSETCTYFRGCPIQKLDIAIAYDLPELVGKYRKLAEQALEKLANDLDKSKSKS